MTNARLAATAFLLAAVLFLASTPAWAKPVVVVTLSQGTVVTAADGTTHLAGMDAAGPIGRGVIIRYTITAKDTGTDVARRLELTGHIPLGTAFAPDSIHGPGGRAEFSLDGKVFSAHPMVTVKTATGDVLQPADPALYVMVRWIKDGPLAAATTSSFSYDVLVK